jgi:acyl dehydratase
MAWEAGQALETRTYTVRRSDLVRYAGASGDFNPIHWSDRIATSVGLPGVIAHGMYTLALAGDAVTVWAGGPEAVLSLGARFTKPVVVPDDDTGTTVQVDGTVKSVEDGVAAIDLTVMNADQKVLGMSKATVRV